MQWFGEHDTGQEVIRYGKWNEKPEAGVRSPEHWRLKIGDQRIQLENQRTEAIRLNQKEAGPSNHKVVRWSNQKREAGRLNQKARGAGTGVQRYPEHNPEGHEQEDDRRMTTGGEATTYKRKKSKPEEEGQRDLAGEGIKSWE
ncbi:hypothetical protein B0H14DRAFT_2596841 [Mycena olivaceomarginata]|nr:hypothetical protein B0H14DRAFT_2596841 [Mycena olivaceomarginata]